MSLPTTPRRSPGLSPDSTPSSTDNGPTSPQLTPRSKIKALLAQVDEDSESDACGHSIALKLQRKVLSSIDGNTQKREEIVDLQPVSTEPGKDSEDAEEDEPILPRGRLAAQLNGGKAERQTPSRGSGDDADRENAYARIKKQLMQRSRLTPEAVDKNLSGPIISSIFPGAEAANAMDHNLSATDTARTTPGNHRKASSDLFLTPPSAPEVPEQRDSAKENISSSDDLPVNPQAKNRFLELVAKKRAEREAKQAAEGAKKKKRRPPPSDDVVEGAANPSLPSSGDEDADRRLTQHHRPTRKASKRALEEMNRETQRMNRNMQLAHQAKTKKKITKESLLARFNYGGMSVRGSSATASSDPVSDHDDTLRKDTPPTSPLRLDEHEAADPKPHANVNNLLPGALISSTTEEQEGGLPDILDVLSQPVPNMDKGKGRAVEVSEKCPPASEEFKRKRHDLRQRPVRIIPPKPPPPGLRREEGSDSDLEVMPVFSDKGSRLAVFDRIPQGKVQDIRPLQTLRALAHLNSPPHSKGRMGRPSVSMADMQIALQRRARQQAVEERKTKIEHLKARGINVQTTEEKEKEQVEVEDMLEKARKEGEEIKERERRAAKKEKLAARETPGLDDSSADEDYDDGDEGDIELSGSEDEDMEIQAEKDEEESPKDPDVDPDGSVADDNVTNALIEDEALETSQDEEDVDFGEGEETDLGEIQARKPRRARLVIDEDDVDEAQGSSTDKAEESLETVSPVVEVPKIFQAMSNAMPMGMTQAFAATMADTQTQKDDDQLVGQDAMTFPSSPPEPNLLVHQAEDSLLMVENTPDRTQESDTAMDDFVGASNEIDLHFSQSQIEYGKMGEMQMQAVGTQYSEIPDPTQDAGFVMSSPAPKRFVSQTPSTVNTILPSDAAIKELPFTKKRGRLHNRIIAEETTDDDKQVSRSRAEKDNDNPANAFKLMEKARKKATWKAEFIKKSSDAKEMVEEQAQESDDEYAGLGGASDEESDGEEDVLFQEMIDESEVNVDGRKLAALYANKQRVDDQKAVEKLFKDINNGGLRRKRGFGADFDLSDSDDGAEARRRRKQREFAKMRKALLENENVGKIAEDPRKLAFLKAIEDREDDDGDLGFLGREAKHFSRVEPGTPEDCESQSQSQLQNQPSNLDTSKQKHHPLQDSAPDKGNIRPPAATRRTHPPKRPATLAEIRDSVSFLVEQPGSFNAADPSSSADEEDENNYTPAPNGPHPNPRRAPAKPIIDRLSLKRVSSASTSGTSHLAFLNPSHNPLSNSFVPSLLRRATTSNLASAADQHGISHATTERAAGGGEKGDFVRRGGTKKSSVNFAAREMQKKAAVEGVERRRREGREMKAKQRASGLQRLGRVNTWEA
ncbi:MAG: hypothetical protein Q9163_003900 [Psora crenata]